MRCPVNLAEAEEGYLRPPAGRFGHVLELDQIVREAVHQGVSLYWDTGLEFAGYCYCWSRVVLLSPWLMEQEPWIVRLVLAEELGHCLVGPNDDRAMEWATARFGDVLTPIDG